MSFAFSRLNLGLVGWFINTVETVRIELASLNAKLVSVTGEEKDETREKNWHLKAISIVQSEWAEVIYLVRLLHPIHSPPPPTRSSK